LIAYTAPPAHSDLKLSDIVPIYRRRRFWIYGITLAFIALAAIYCAICTVKYDSTGIVEIKETNTDGLNLDTVNGGAAHSTDAMSEGMNLQTQVDILKSDSLALKTIEDLNLEHTADFQGHGPIATVVGAITGLFPHKPSTDHPGASLEDSPQRRDKVVRIFEGNLKVKPQSGGRLIDITYRSSNPEIAAAVVNHLIRGLTDYEFETRVEATSQSSQWLAKQLADLRRQSEETQSRVVMLQQGVGVYTTGGTDAVGNALVYNRIIDHLQQTTTALAEAKANRILREAVYGFVKSGNPDMLSGLVGNSSGTSSGGSNNSFMLLQNLRQQQATLQQQISFNKAKFGDAYAPLREQEASLAGVNTLIQNELDRIGGRAKSDYMVALTQEKTSQADYDAALDSAQRLNSRAAELTIARQEAENSRALYDDLLKRSQEAGILQGWRPSNIAVVDPGRVPGGQSKPLPLLYLAIATFAGLFFGAGTAFIVDNVDDKIQTVDEIGQNLPVLGSIPYLTRRRGLVLGSSAADSPTELIEAMRGVRASLMLSRRSTPPQVVLVTSAISGEGKTTFSKNLAVLLAGQRRKVLLVDVDLRRFQADKRLNATAEKGLSDLLANESLDHSGESFMTNSPDIPGLFVLKSGSVPPDPTELLDSPRMRELIGIWRRSFDVVILDSPPVLQFTDAISLNGAVDTVILVARLAFTPRTACKQAYELIEERMHPANVRVVLNGVKADKKRPYTSYGMMPSKILNRSTYEAF
jgi:capsular exopolysaccharide synthesis family protein